MDKRVLISYMLTGDKVEIEKLCGCPVLESKGKRSTLERLRKIMRGIDQGYSVNLELKGIGFKAYFIQITPPIKLCVDRMEWNEHKVVVYGGKLEHIDQNLLLEERGLVLNVGYSHNCVYRGDQSKVSILLNRSTQISISGID